MTDCEFGNKVDWCSKQRVTQCYSTSYREDCCATCNQHNTGIKGKGLTTQITNSLFSTAIIYYRHFYDHWQVRSQDLLKGGRSKGWLVYNRFLIHLEKTESILFGKESKLRSNSELNVTCGETQVTAKQSVR